MNAPTKISASRDRYSSTAEFMRRSVDMEPPYATDEHMPFFGHRTMAEIAEEQNRREILRGLGRRAVGRG